MCNHIPQHICIYIAIITIAKLILIGFIIKFQKDYSKSCDKQLEILKSRHKKINMEA
jgi:hypothetical protein